MTIFNSLKKITYKLKNQNEAFTSNFVKGNLIEKFVKYPYRVYFLLIFNTLLNFGISAQGILPFDPRDCGLNCSANDVNITGAQLYADIAGTMPLSGTCTPGTNLNAYIGITFVNNSNANRGVIALAADIYFNGIFSNELKYCPSLILAGSETKVFVIPIAITWVCGQSIELRDILGGWATGGSLTTCPTACNGITASKCSDTVPNITVITPPTALFAFTCAPVPSFRTIVFTNNSTGGAPTSLIYSWNFGDGTPLVTTASPTHTFTGAGPFNVSLTTTNTVGSDTEIIVVTAGNCDVQPITLLSFKVAKSENYNELTWTTSNAVQFSHFEVEKSSNAHSYKVIGKVDGIGQGKEAQQHSFLDENAFGLNYYRLKMVDLDGKYQFSKIITINNEAKNNSVGLIFPNPSVNNAQIKLISYGPTIWTVKIFDHFGKFINSQTQFLHSNENIIEVNNLIKGVNFIQFSDGNITEIRKVINL